MNIELITLALCTSTLILTLYREVTHNKYPALKQQVRNSEQEAARLLKVCVDLEKQLSEFPASDAELAYKHRNALQESARLQKVNDYLVTQLESIKEKKNG